MECGAPGRHRHTPPFPVRDLPSLPRNHDGKAAIHMPNRGDLPPAKDLDFDHATADHLRTRLHAFEMGCRRLTGSINPAAELPQRTPRSGPLAHCSRQGGAWSFRRPPAARRRPDV